MTEMEKNKEIQEEVFKQYDEWVEKYNNMTPFQRWIEHRKLDWEIITCRHTTIKDKLSYILYGV